MTSVFIKSLIERAADPYRPAGYFAWHFARGKLRGDPVFTAMLEHGLIPDNARIVDIGCGQGLLASWLLTAKAMHDNRSGPMRWPTHWPPAPNPASINGIELMPRVVERARQALGKSATFTVGNMCNVAFGKADAVVILDVLHYVSIAEQNDVLARVRDALSPGGTLLLRVGDASAGVSFKFSVLVDHVVTFVRGNRNSRLYCRPLSDWCNALALLGFAVTTLPMNKGTPFANILLIARLAPNPGIPKR